jgi:hypothetical protein
MRPRLRLFTGDENLDLVAPASVSLTFGELTRILDHASRSQRAWLRDFDDDEVHIPEDLYDVLMEYWRMRPGA